MKQYKIGDVARMLGVTTQALRFYEQEGVIVPHKSENGTRYYTESDIVRLMAFKRFQLMDFSVQNVAEHFKRGTLDSLLLRMTDACTQLRRESERLLLRAQAAERFERILRMAREGVGQADCVTRPLLYLHPCPLGELENLAGRQRETFDLFMDAMPDAHICFLYDPGKAAPLKFHFTIAPSSAEAWQLPLAETLCLEGGPCIRTFVRTDARLWQAAYLNEQIARTADAGYQVDKRLPVIVQHLASENIGKQGYLIAAIYVPIICNLENLPQRADG